MATKAEPTEIPTTTSGGWVERLARFGYITKGLIYFLVGSLAALTAIGVNRAPQGAEGVLLQITEQSFGTALLVALGVGLAGYVLWRIVQAVMDAEDKGHDWKGLAQRAGYLVSAVVYGTLAVTVFQALRHTLQPDGDAARDWTARVLAWPFGPWLVAGAGLLVMGVGVAEIYRAARDRFRRDLKEGEMDQEMGREMSRSMLWLGRVGIAARGAVWGLTGLFLVRAALSFNAEEAEGLGGALERLVLQPYGSWLLGAVAAGLMAFGLFTILEGRYRYIDVPKPE